MKTNFLLTPLIALYLSLISATTIPIAQTKTAEDTTAKAMTSVKPASELKAKKMGFFQRLAFKIAMHKLKKHHYKIDDVTKADKLASASLTCGIASLVIFFIPYLGILSIPLSILAIIFGNRAKKLGTTKPTKASVGKGLGIASLILFAVLLIVVIAYISAWASL